MLSTAYGNNLETRFSNKAVKQKIGDLIGEFELLPEVSVGGNINGLGRSR